VVETFKKDLVIQSIVTEITIQEVKKYDGKVDEAYQERVMA
jgi:hypothetical protein